MTLITQGIPRKDLTILTITSQIRLLRNNITFLHSIN